jgi:PleD family two-component response regulator
MIDIDHFKKFNDKYGHTEGDNVLRYAAQHLYEESGSRIYRYGGEEFAAIFRGMEIEDVFWHVDRMREKLSKMNFYLRMPETIRRKKSPEDRGKKEITTKKVHITVSIGIAQRTMVCKTPKCVIEAADKALYRAKKKGRNQCVKAKA